MLVKQLVLSKIPQCSLYVNLPDVDIKRLQEAVNAAGRFRLEKELRLNPSRPVFIVIRARRPVRQKITYKICLLASRQFTA